jgi:hydroxymethylbilane synthase
VAHPQLPAIRLGARRSPLARAQVDLVAALLAERGVPATFVGITTTGDVDRRQLTEIGGTGVFASAVRDALKAGEIDVAVHSLKDLPTATDDELEVLAVPVREDTRDVLVGARLDELPDGARVGTGAPRRSAQLQDWAERAGRRLEIVPVRGNVDTRIDLVRSGTVDAVVLAAAGLRRLGRMTLAGTDNSDTVVSGLQAQILDHQVMLPAPGQGALALEIHRSLSAEIRAVVGALDDPIGRAESLAERGFLATLEAGCTAPVGARAVVKSVRGTSLDLTLAAVIGRTLLSNLSEPTKSGPGQPVSSVLRIEVRGVSDDPAQFGALQADQVLMELRDPQGPRR